MQYLMNPITGSASVLPTSFSYLFFSVWLYSALWYDTLAVLHRQNLAFVAFSLFPLLVCIPLTLSLIPLSLVVMGTVRLSHVWGSHQGLDEAMINEQERKSRNDERKGHISACTLSHQPCQTLIPGHTGSIVHTTH